MRVAIIGQGYVGLTIAVGAASAGHKVIGFDVNDELVAALNAGTSHIEGISDSSLSSFIGSGAYKASTDASVIDGCDVIVIAVPTPLDEARNPDLSFVHAAAELIAKNAKSPALVINESTSYPGTLRKEIAARITGVAHLYASSPERVDPGNTKWGTKNTPRLIGGLTPAAVAKAKEFYATFCDTIFEVSSPEVAEAAKIFENTFRQVNIALVNEFAQIADALGISGREVLDAAATKPYGFMEFNPGPGVGGHCIPVDPSYLAHVANEVGVPATFIKRANEVNLGMPAYVVKRVVAGSGGSIKGKKVVVVGVSYKSNVADTRETPAAGVIDLLRAQGATVAWHDDLVGSWRGESTAPIRGEEIAVLVTKHDGLDLAALKSCGYIFDCTGSIAGADGI
ncbi:MAG: nucleotide sugar dehydrogenase [Micrococcales bacterium]|nr:nucleotide sugar dehydrogenase [Microbacteriaceae bacterium]NBR23710.1 nucleotide sugar dehydrogenase [Micrococcales bacterium]